MCVICVELPVVLATLVSLFPFLRSRITAIYKNYKHNRLRSHGAL